MGVAAKINSAVMWSHIVPNWPTWLPNGKPVHASKGMVFG